LPQLPPCSTPDINITHRVSTLEKARVLLVNCNNIAFPLHPNFLLSSQSFSGVASIKSPNQIDIPIPNLNSTAFRNISCRATLTYLHIPPTNVFLVLIMERVFPYRRISFGFIFTTRWMREGALFDTLIGYRWNWN
jgi:hypothetical protein